MTVDYAREIAILRAKAEEKVPVEARLEEPGVLRVSGGVSSRAPIGTDDWEPYQLELRGALWDHEALFWTLAHEAGHLFRGEVYTWETSKSEVLRIELNAWIWALAYAQTREVALSPEIAQRARRALETYVLYR